MNPLNDLYTARGQYAWTTPNSFEEPHYHNGGAPFAAPELASSSAQPGFNPSTPSNDTSRPPTVGPSRTHEPIPSQGRSRGLGWDVHRAELKKLYLEENKTLNEIMQWMRVKNSFSATSKQYKDRFKVWGWQKNLPVETAQFIVRKADQRKRAPMHKDTTFTFGGMTWTRERAEATIKRTKKQISETIDVSTPSGVIYQTPINVDTTSPESALTPHEKSGEADENMASSSSDEWEYESDADSNALPLVWENKTRADVHALFVNARRHAQDGDAEGAERMLKTALSGYNHLLGPTHEETNKVVHTLATLYYEHDRLQDAYQLLEQSCKAYVKKVGMQDRRAYQQVLNVVELLHGWNKGDDALAFLARAKDLAEQQNSESNAGRHRQKNSSSAPNRRPATSHGTLLSDAAYTLSNHPQTSAELEYGLRVARAHASTESTAVEQLLITTINQCGQDANTLAVQRLKAWAELLRLYQRSGDETAGITSYQDAHATFSDVMRRYPWQARMRNKFESFRVIEAALELVAAYVKASYLNDAKLMFQKCDERATQTFGDDDERTIWTYISVGLVYQKYRNWEEARPWFEQALSIAMGKYNEDDGTRISLEEAMEVRHFSYVNDEGRPYRTIFGVGGLKIMPMRLHIE
ncbi:hypothetical protein BDU57DRAFT_522148 [Ampelomyces quisqualis]|uniref:Clr5 domain-containing protein n=1 Tax=Ampelomyces quisqualis TaxID=50730 RepID=A0A6A5QD91_AMPQU|nr:hypothetical protein BDU57DRAFT_522148 [Ampelomyces quisqualis]